MTTLWLITSGEWYTTCYGLIVLNGLFVTRAAIHWRCTVYYGDHVMYHTGMAGKDDVADAVLGGASDFMSDISAKILQWYRAKDDEKVLCILEV